jgi:hypothetical protein
MSAALPQHVPSRRAEHIEWTLDCGQPLARDMQVTQGAVDVGMTKQHLDGANVDAHLEKVGGIGVPEHVGKDALLQARGSTCPTQSQTDSRPRYWLTRNIAGEEVRALRPDEAPVLTQGEQQLLAQGQVTIPAPLPLRT